MTAEKPLARPRVSRGPGLRVPPRRDRDPHILDAQRRLGSPRAKRRGARAPGLGPEFAGRPRRRRRARLLGEPRRRHHRQRAARGRASDDRGLERRPGLEPRDLANDAELDGQHDRPGTRALARGRRPTPPPRHHARRLVHRHGRDAGLLVHALCRRRILRACRRRSDDSPRHGVHGALRSGALGRSDLLRHNPAPRPTPACRTPTLRRSTPVRTSRPTSLALPSSRPIRRATSASASSSRCWPAARLRASPRPRDGRLDWPR